MLQDAHIHLQDAGTQGAKILEEASRRGVGRFFCNASAPSGWESVKTLAASSDKVLPFFGVHPWYADEARGDWVQALVKYLSVNGSSIGEIGLDKARKAVSFERQLEVFSAQLDIAVGMNRPFAVHCVQAWEPLIDSLSRRGGKIPPFILHWFSGSAEVAESLIKLGGYISFSPRILDRSAEKQRASLAKLPADRILLETDYPFTPGVRTPGVGNGGEGAAEEYFQSIGSVYECAAKIRGMDAQEFAERVWSNGTVFVH